MPEGKFERYLRGVAVTVCRGSGVHVYEMASRGLSVSC